MSFFRIPQPERTYEAAVRHTVPGKSTSFAQSLRYAARGVGRAFRTEINLRTHLLALAVVVGAGASIGISLNQWALLVLVSCTVVGFELVNSALEAFADAVHPTYHVAIAKAKDIAAGAVLLVSAGAVIIGILIFGVPLLRLLAA